MATNTLKTRIKHKYGTPAEWAQATNFSPLQGELVVYDGEVPKIKIGDGETNVEALPFITDECITVDLNNTEAGIVPKTNANQLGGLDAENYATKAFVSAEIANAQLSGGDNDIDLSGYMLKTDTAVNSQKLGGVAANEYALKEMVENLTAGDVGAAPAGYGWGTDLPCFEYQTADDANKTSVFYATQGTPTPGYGTWLCEFYSTSTGGAYGHMVATCQDDGKQGCVCTRLKVDNVWQPWEWMNPPAQLGVEYRTVERIDGKAVYKKNIDGIINYRLDGETEWKPYSKAVGAAPTGYGLGTNAGKWADDLNTATEAGWYATGIDTANRPDLVQYGAVLVMVRTSTDFVQIAIDVASGIIAERVFVAGSFKEWKYINGRQARTVTVNSSFVNSGSITAETSGNILKIGGYLETKVQQAGDGADSHLICTIPGVKVNGNTYATVIDHSTGKPYNILLFYNGTNTVVKLEAAAYALPAYKWLNFGIVGIIE